MRARKLDTDVRQEQIAEAALKIIADRGLGGLNMARLARRVGIVPSAIYRHFEGKEQVLDAVLDLIGSRLRENVSSVCGEMQNPLEQLHALLMRHVALIRENEAIPRLIFSESVYGGEPARRRKLYGIIQGYLKRIADIVKEGQETGQIQSDIAPEKVAVMFLGMIQPGAILWHLSDGEFDVTKQAETAWEVFSAALRTRSHKDGRATDG